MSNIIQMDLGGVSSYLLENNGKFFMIDAGGHMFLDKTYDSRLDILKRKLEENGVTSENLKLLLLTHGDCDHVFNAEYIQNEYGVPVAIHKADEWMVNNPQWDCYKYNSKYSSKIMTLIFKILNGKIEKLMKRVYGDFKSFKPDILLEEGSDLSHYGMDIKIYSTPGHTDGSISIIFENEHLFCGDLFAANNGKPAYAINAKDFKQLKEMGERVMSLPIKKVYPGHGISFNADKL